MPAIDLKKDPTYKAKPDPSIINVPTMRFVMVDGAGAPDSSDAASTEFQVAMQVIYGIVYSVKFWDKKHAAPKGYAKFTMPPVEAQWWTKSGKPFDLNAPDDWLWTAMHRVPEFVTQALFDQIVEELCDKKKSDIYKKARLEDFNEGSSVQLLHMGPYDQEGPNIERLHAFAKDQGYKLHGKHHELYFNDPRRVAPEKVKTILRQPVEEQ